MKDLRDRLKTQGVHTLMVQFTDIHGVAKGKFVPLAHLDDVLTDGAGFSGPSIAGSGMPRVGPHSEYAGRGQATTITPLPWMPGVARIVVDGFAGDKPFDACPRQVLKRAVAVLADRGWSLRVGIEPEFYLLKRDGSDFAPADLEDRLDNPAYDLRSLARQLPFLHDLQDSLERCGVNVTQIDHEDGRGQFEINFAPSEALLAADQLMLVKLAAQTLAERHGMLFSMMPKPFPDMPGSGMHFHVSMWKGTGADASCQFTPHLPDGAADRSRTLSARGSHFAAGVLDHAAALCALGAPTINSYKRLQAGASVRGDHWAPAYVAHGTDNRTALVRTLHGRFEWRLPDASANPYLVLAGLILSGLDGIDRELDIGAECRDDLFALSAQQIGERGLALLPRNLEDAADALESDATVCGALGDTLVTQFLHLKRAESAEFARHVSDWERQRYAAAF
jgi:glutamine synthetase